MPNITKPRKTQQRDLINHSDPVRAATKLILGGAYGLDVNGFAIKMESGAVAKARGVVQKTVDNLLGADGAKKVEGKSCVSGFHILGTSVVDAGDIGSTVYFQDDQTVAKGSNGGLRPVAGELISVDGAVAYVAVGPVASANSAGSKGVLTMVVDTLVGSGVTRLPLPDDLITITKIKSVLQGALATGDAVLTFAINAVDITGGVVTITQAASAAGDLDEAVPTALNLSDGVDDQLRCTLSGTNSAAVKALITVEYVYN